MHHSNKSRQLLGTIIQTQFACKVIKRRGCLALTVREYITDPSPHNGIVPSFFHTWTKWAASVFPYQFCSAVFNQRHMWYFTNTRRYTKGSLTTEFRRLMSTIDTSKGGPVMESGGRLGKLDSATESGMFHKVNKSKLEQLKKTLKDKPTETKTTPDPAAKSEE